MRALKILVVVMGVLLVGGSVALIAAIVDRARHRLVGPAAAPVPVPAPASALVGPGRSFDHAVIDLPAGARVIATEAAGERLIVRIGLAEGGEALILIDLRSGARLGTIELRPASGGPGKS